MNERIRQVRKALGLNQTEFGAKLGIKQGTVAGYETGAKNPMDSVIKSICREFNVSESWLRTGDGEMFLEKTHEEALAEMAADLMLDADDSFRKRLILALAKMDAEGWNHLQHVYEILREYDEQKEEQT